MEKTLLINDFLFVSKFSYGPRIPNTPLSIPFVHNYIPGTGMKSYSTLIQLPYIRWFGSAVKRSDVVVFNFPEGDTVINLPEYQSFHPYYTLLREEGGGDPNKGRQVVLSDPDKYPLAIHPADKTDNYIKRCVAIAGDTISIAKGVVYINSVAQNFPAKSLMPYLVETHGQLLDEEIMKEEYNVDISNPEQYAVIGANKYIMNLTADAVDKLKKNSSLIKNINIQYEDTSYYTPQMSNYVFEHGWSVDKYGPIWIPKKGSTLNLKPDNYTIYERAIRVYEHNDFEMKDGKFFLNGKEITSYTFKMNYYWMMGDNRHGSQDSRFWWFVPEDRVVGKAWMIWFSWENGPRWNRLFRIVR